jgi:hypothetical protein
MAPSRLAAIFIFVGRASGEHFPGFVQDVIANLPAKSVEIRMGFSQCDYGFFNVLGGLCPDGVTPEHHEIPGGVQRFQWVGRNELTIRAWVSSTSEITAGRMAQRMYHDVKLDCEYVIFLNGDLPIKSGWWEALAPRLEERIDYIGKSSWHDYSVAQLEAIQSHAWYMGIPFDRREGRLGVSFVPWGLLAVRSERLREAGFPNLGFREAERTQGLTEDVILGEMARQFGWTRAIHEWSVETNAETREKNSAMEIGFSRAIRL